MNQNMLTEKTGSRPISITVLSWLLIIPSSILLIILLAISFTHLSKDIFFLISVFAIFCVFEIYCGKQFLKRDKSARTMFLVGSGLLLAVILGTIVMDAFNSRKVDLVPFIVGCLWFGVYYFTLNTKKASRYFESTTDKQRTANHPLFLRFWHYMTKNIFYLAVVTTIACAWLWQTGVLTTQSTEERLSIIFQPDEFNVDVDDDDVGSITLIKKLDGRVVPYKERPGDIVSMGGLIFIPSASLTSDVGSVTSASLIRTANGSELRFYGTFETAQGSITGKKNGRLVFRKTYGSWWAYVSGLGYYEEQGEITKLGYNRTVKSCLALLKSEDPILQEGCARDLGRLWSQKNEGWVVHNLSDLLKSKSVTVRRGAIEGLGLIGTSDALSELRKAYVKEKDRITLVYFEEAFGFCAAYTLLAEPKTSKNMMTVGLDYLASKKGLGNWTVNNLHRRIATHRQKALANLEKSTTDDNSKIAHVATLIKKALHPPETIKK